MQGSFSLQASLILLTFLSRISFIVHVRIGCAMRSGVRGPIGWDEIRLRKVFVRGIALKKRSAIAFQEVP